MKTALLTLVLTALASLSLSAETADFIYHNGMIIMIDDARPSVEAVAVKDGKILAAGTKNDVLKTAGEGMKKIEAPAAGESRIIKDEGIEIEAFVFGEGSETLIIAAGNGRPAADLEELAKGIAKGGIRVVTYNYRTIGASKGPIADVTLHDYAHDVWRIADALGAKKVHLAGKTYGNRVMRTASADRPERTLSVTLIGAGGEILPSPEIQTKYKRYVDPKTPKEEWLKLQAELMFAPGNEHLAKRSAKSGKYPELASAQVKASNATPKREWTAAGTAPMLILTGLQDLVAVPENGLKLAKERPDTWLVGIPNCGHNMVFEQPEELTRLITEFIESATAKPGQSE